MKKAKKEDIFTKEVLEERFDYDRDSGKLYHKQGQFKGKSVGSLNPQGYLATTLYKNGKQYYFLLHRLIWVIEGNSFEDGLVLDHVNHDKADNRISNLRMVTHKENSKNRRAKDKPIKVEASKDFLKTSVMGVTLSRKSGIYWVTGGGKIIGQSYDFDQAKYIRWNWEFDNGFHENHGITP